MNAATRREEKGPQVSQATPAVPRLEISEQARHTEAKSTYEVSAYRIPTHVRVVRPTQSPDPAAGVTWPQSPGQHTSQSTVSRVTHLPDPAPGVTHPQSPG